MPPAPVSERVFEHHVLPAELDEIVRRRKTLGVPYGPLKGVVRRRRAAPQPPVSLLQRLRDLSARLTAGTRRSRRSEFEPVEPSSELGLVGLAMSGGGIRSATYNLGVVQALAEKGMLRRVDYLSTVSGGGYLGSCLSSLLDVEDDQPFPLGLDEDGTDRPAMRHLRDRARYLASGWSDLLRIPALLLRGILVNFATLLPYLVGAVWLTWWIVGARLRGAAAAGSFELFYQATIWTLGAFAAWSLLSPLVTRWWSALTTALRHLAARWRSEGRGWRAGFARWMADRPLLTGGFQLRDLYERTFAGLLLAVIVALVADLALTAFSFLHMVIEAGGGWAEFEETWWWTALLSFAGYLAAGLSAPRLERLRGKIGLVAAGLLGPLLLFWVYLYLGEWMIFERTPEWMGTAGLAGATGLTETAVPASWWLLTVAVAGLAVYAWRFVDVNATSLHSYYRDRLSRSFLIKLRDGRCVHEDRRLLSELGTSGRCPYHLINATLNLPADRDAGIRRRGADFFLFSKHWTGSARTGYCSTRELEAADPRVDLGTAMAISGAAAAPNMGTTTIKPLVFLLALLNVRLGYWLPNPRRLQGRAGLIDRWLRGGVGPIYLLRELLGLIDEKSAYVNVSDGGHIENLGIYELLRRRCRYIVACDAEADEKLHFGGLAKLMRYAEIDLGVKIELDLQQVRPGPEGYSQRYCAIGHIHYPSRGGRPPEIGYLLYVKAALVGREPESIREYRARNAAFPHESTADQFFDEAQFESYRALGRAAGDDLFPRLYEGPGEWFADLGERLHPVLAEGEVVASLENRWTDLLAEAAAPELAGLLARTYPEAGLDLDGPRRTIDVEADGSDRRAFLHAHRQLVLADQIVSRLRLDLREQRLHPAHRGWLNLLRRWASTVEFRQCWVVAIGTLGEPFQRFCEEHLGLQSRLEWRTADGLGALSHGERRHLDRLNLVADGVLLVGLELRIAWLAIDAPPESSLSEPLAIPVGSMVLRRSAEEDSTEVLFYGVRHLYRRMGLFRRMLEHPPEPSLVFVPAEGNWQELAAYAYLFEQRGHRVQPRRKPRRRRRRRQKRAAA